ncbi:MAG: cupin domain-containing protein [Myxococcaceae bacterium]|nr:cupin domain-containing protein [Myxococcaceae bacterium]
MRSWKERLEGPERFFHLAEPLAGLLGLREAEAAALLHRLADPDAWEDGPSPEVRLMPALCGPSRAGALAVFLELQPSAALQHAHLGDEDTLVLQGGFREADGAELWRGDTCSKPEGSRHALTALDGVPCIMAVVTSAPGAERE